MLSRDGVLQILESLVVEGREEEIVVELIGWERPRYIPLAAGDLARHNAKHYGFLLLEHGQGGARQGTSQCE